PVAALVAAVKSGDVGKARTLLQNYPELKSKVDDSLPGLHFNGTLLLSAVSSGNRQMIDILLEAGADINRKSRWWAGGFGVLDDAADQNAPDWLAAYLVQRGGAGDIRPAVQLWMVRKIKKLLH